MNIQSTQSLISSPLSANALKAKADQGKSIGQAKSQDDFIPSDSATFSSETMNNLKSIAILGGVGLVGAAIGAAGGNYTGVIGGLAGAVAGASGGVTLAVALPGDRIKTGLLMGAVGGAIVGSSFGNPGMAVGLGLAGGTLPLGIFLAALSGSK